MNWGLSMNWKERGASRLRRMLVNGGSWLRKQSVKEGALTRISMNLFRIWYKRTGNELF